MQPRILTRFTTIVLFVFTCFLTMDVVANERGLAPHLTPDAWKLLSDADSYIKGLPSAVVTKYELTPRPKSTKRMPIKLPNSRLKVKFADELQIRLDLYGKPYSRTQRPAETITTLCDGLGVTLSPTLRTSQERIDALILRAETKSRKQQPDIGGVYWVDGDETSVDRAADYFYAMDEVEWVIYKPVFSKIERTAPTKRAVKTAKHAKPIAAPRTKMYGACLLKKGRCLETVEQRDCIERDGVFLGQNSVCTQQTEERSTVGGAGECCTVTTCNIVVDEDECLDDFNGIYLGVNEDEPPDPCGESQTDCPALNGPLFSDYNDCAEDGDPISYLTGDCYIDQTSVTQTGRTALDNPEKPIGCLDTDGTLGGPGGNDFVVVTGLPSGFGSNIFFDSECCETITTNVPDCNLGPWTAVCASYAQGYALDGSGICERGSANTPPNVCFNPYGPTIPPAVVQSGVNLDDISDAGSGITIMGNNSFGVETAMVEIVDFIGEGCEAGGCQMNFYTDLMGQVGAIPLFPVEGFDLNALGAEIAADPALVNFQFTIEGDGAVEASSLNPIASVAVYNEGNTNNPVQPQTLSAVPLLPIGCLPPAGAPTYPRSATTPDYAALGLLTTLSPDVIPWPGSLTAPPQPLALPNSPTTLTTNDFNHIYQLLPWPMGGASGQGVGSATTVINPPLSESALVGGTGWWGGDLPLETFGSGYLFPDAPNSGGFGGQEIYKGSYGYGQMWEDDGVGTNGAFGAGVKVAVLDWSAHLQQRTNNAGINLGGIHEEFLDANGDLRVTLEGEATGHPELILEFDENLPFRLSADHGTAVLGVIGANWGPASAVGVPIGNSATPGTRMFGNVGILGLAPDADLYFFPLATIDEPDREPQAWFNTLETLDAGDVISAGYQPVAVTNTSPNLNYWEDTNMWLGMANTLGIITVIKAGDLGLDMSELEFPDSGGDQNAIVATSVSPGTPFKRYADSVRGSNAYFGTAQDYAVVTASGFGIGTITCGKGQQLDNFLGYNTIVYADATDPHIVHRQAYTNVFGHTDAAAATVAGCVAQIQGFTKQIFEGMPLGPQICRQLTAGGKYEGINRDGLPVLTNRPSIDTESTLDSECELPNINYLDWDWCDEDPTTGFLTGNLVNPRASMVNVIHNPIFDTPNIYDAVFIRGNHFTGSIYSLAAVDNNLLGATPVRVNANQAYPVPDGVPGPVWYSASGLTTDLYLTGELLSSIPTTNALSLSVTFSPIQQELLFVRAEMLDHRTGKWRPVAGSLLAPGDTNVLFTIEQATNYIKPQNNEYHLRLITLGGQNPPDGNPTAVYPVAYDQVIFSGGIIQGP